MRDKLDLGVAITIEQTSVALGQAQPSERVEAAFIPRDKQHLPSLFSPLHPAYLPTPIS